MKKLMTLALAVIMVLALVACGGAADDSAAGGNSTGFGADSAVAVLENAWTSYPEDQKFPVMGGDYENMVENAPGAVNHADAEYMESMLGVTADAAAMVDGAASLIHAMMTNNFTCGAYHLTDAANTDAFVAAMKDSLTTRQWICGQPEKIVIVSDGAGYVVAMFGLADPIDGVAAQLTAMGGTVVVDEPVA